MKRFFAVILLMSVIFLPSCIKKTTVKQIKPTAVTQQQAPTVKSASAQVDKEKAGAYDEDLGAYVLEDEAEKDLFDAADTKVKSTGVEKPADKAKKLSDDSWAWQELDEDSSAEVVHFDFDRSEIRKDQEPLVKYNAQLAKLAVADGATIIIEGYSCLITRSQLYNQALSQRRADAIKNIFIKFGVPANSIKAVGRGTSNLITKAPGKEAQAPNRRVEVKFLYPRNH